MWRLPLKLVKRTTHEELLERNEELLERNEELQSTVHSLNPFDELTGLHDEQHFFEVVSTEIYRASQYDGQLSLVRIDIDGFKGYNDTFGYPVGDDTLKEFAEVLKSELNSGITPYRHGDEFTFIMPAIGAEDAGKIIDQLREIWSSHNPEFYRKNCIQTPPEFSAGIAQYPDDATLANDLLKKAYAALWHFKDSGRNKTTLAAYIN